LLTSSDSVAIRCEGIAKRYQLGEHERYRTLRDTIAGLVGRSRRPAPRTIWALDDVSFDVPQGTVLGVIGRNGAGKSTLLKILSRITRPTRGRATLTGRVGSLLEVGTGFHPELTGRENILLNGAILGMKRREILRRFDEIVAFAETEQFLDTPVKRYSSGMFMRLAFAVAAHLEPEILVVDEVLAVGDAAFQKKCLGKMGNVASTGRTVLFVSHNMSAVQSLCSRVLWLDAGRIAADGPPDRVVRDYLARVTATRNEERWDERDSAPGNETVRLKRVAVRAGDGSDLITIDTPIEFEFEYWNLAEAIDLHVGLFLHNQHGVTILYAEPGRQGEWHTRPLIRGLFRDVCSIPGRLLNDGGYSVDVVFVLNDEILVFRYDDALRFDVREVGQRERAWYSNWAGVIRLSLDWNTTLQRAGLDDNQT
jgi:lipopolysaccharide transport system ATP-binding protein